ncbi:MAG: pyridoxamine 5'-phosphate oxidase [Bacteroidetes bacterium]|nr:pyridoxamine 5'-phosphate oxidase [Bacteroidota bacterium]MCK5764426.1 pyridoxamine 5'-phosphate oxidase [Bacteroidales bacterium]
MSDKKLIEYRREYLAGELLEENILKDPYLQFSYWLDEAILSGINDPTAMALATSDASGNPSVRIVLLKDARPEGFVFFTNYQSRKASELDDNPRAAVMFFWPGLDRQVRIEGKIEKISIGESNEFFRSRPVGSRIASIISPQGEVIPARDFLEQKFQEYSTRLDDENIERPDHWGGYILKPKSYEFWQGRENRLNDRIQYVLLDGRWGISRLAP